MEFVVKKIEYVTYNITDADKLAIDFMLTCQLYDGRRIEDGKFPPYNTGNKIAAIKYFRARFNTSLKEAKDAIDQYCEELMKARSEPVSEAVADAQSLGALLRNRFNRI